MTNTLKAIVAPVQIGHITIDGLMLPNGDFAIAVSQIAELFRFDKNQASRTLKPLLGGDFQFDTAKSELHPKAVNILSLTDFEIVILELVIRGNEAAIAFQRSLVGLALIQIFNRSFGIKFDEVDAQKWLRDRQDGKGCRRSLTDAIKALIDRGEDLNYGLITLKTYSACNLSSEYAIYRKTHKDSKFRDTLEGLKLRNVGKFEELVADFVIVDNLSLEEAMEKAARYIR